MRMKFISPSSSLPLQCTSELAMKFGLGNFPLGDAVMASWREGLFVQAIFGPGVQVSV